MIVSFTAMHNGWNVEVTGHREVVVAVAKVSDDLVYIAAVEGYKIAAGQEVRVDLQGSVPLFIDRHVIGVVRADAERLIELVLSAPWVYNGTDALVWELVTHNWSSTGGVFPDRTQGLDSRPIATCAVRAPLRS